MCILGCCSSVTQSCLTLYGPRPHGVQHARLPCPLPSPGACSNSCPLSQFCHPTISSSVAPFSSCPQSFPASGAFSMSQLFASGGQRIAASASTTVLQHLGLHPSKGSGQVEICPPQVLSSHLPGKPDHAGLSHGL